MTISEAPDAFFLVSTGRCGSTLISNLLRDFSSVLSVSEFFTVLGGPRAFSRPALDGAELVRAFTELDEDLLWLVSSGDPLAELLWRPPVLDPADPKSAPPLLLIPLPHLSTEPASLLEQLRAVTAAFSRQPTARAYAQVFEWLRARHGKRAWLERSGGSLEYVHELIRGWPTAKFVHLFRDGCECALSMQHHPAFRLRVARALARGEPLPASRLLAREIPLDRYGAYWSASVTRGMNALQRLAPDQVLHVRFEDLLSRPADGLQRLFAFLGEPPPSQAALTKMCARLRPPAPRAQELVPRERERLARVCRPGAQALEALSAAEGTV